MKLDLHPDTDRRNSPELVVVIPVHNEQESIHRVIHEWMDELGYWCEDFVVLAIDDGSRDHSLKILRRLQEQFESRLLIMTHPNRGHGQTCLEGYRYGIKMGARYLFQIDSDGQCNPRYFYCFWRIREQFAVVYGVRTTRDDGWIRVVISKTLRLTLLLAFGVNCPDANVPYRLMKTDAVTWAIDRIPKDFHLANIALAILLARDKSCSHGLVAIGFRKRYGRKSGVKPLFFGRQAVELYLNIRKMFSGQQTRVE